MKRIAKVLAMGLALVLALAGCSDVIDAGPLSTGDTGDRPNGAVVPETRPDATDALSEDDDTAPEASDKEPGASDTTSPRTPESGKRTTGGNETETTSIRLYFMAPGGGTPARAAGPFLVSVHREIPSTPGIARASLTELVDGPSGADKALIDGVASAVPADTIVLDINIDDGLATVDLSREFESGGGSFSILARLAQVVYTVTQFPTVDEVEFRLDGEPVTVFSGEGIVLDGPASRDDFVDLLPAVFVDSPAAGAEVQGSLRASGMATVFEATFQYRLAAADGTVLAEGFAMTDGGEDWGSFDVTIGFDLGQTQQGTLTVWEYSAKDGTIQAERVTPLVLAP
jgi:spore germination protein GerM